MHDRPAVERFRSLVKIPTVSTIDDADTDWAAFAEFRLTVERAYPLVHAHLEREVVAGHSLLYRWRGSSGGSADPAVLMAHYDVVPVTQSDWSHDPFAAELSGAGDTEVLWGRGAIDDKGSLVAILEAVEGLLARGFEPSADIWLSFGHDEETSGSGAIAIVEVLRERGIRPRFVIDEGGAIVDGVFPGIARPLAVVGVSERGIATVTMTVELEGGHASTPQRETAPSVLARAITRVTERPFPARLSAPTVAMLRSIGVEATGFPRLAYRSAGLLAPVLATAFARLGPETNAMVRTTAAVTMLSGSKAANVLAERATAVVNLRIAVGSRVGDAVERLRAVIADERVVLSVSHAFEPSPVSPMVGAEWELIASAVRHEHPEAIVTPYIQLGASDSRHFTTIAENVYRFTPFELDASARAALHAVDEHIPLTTWQRGIRVYERIIEAL